MACGTDDGMVHVWDLGSARKVSMLEGHVGPVWSLSYSQWPGNILASGERRKHERDWREAQPTEVLLRRAK